MRKLIRVRSWLELFHTIYRPFLLSSYLRGHHPFLPACSQQNREAPRHSP
ncbi:hypothetical protein E1A91_A13G185400v1 [Gossypium mustelinum]|uniref:Uncharacterized protein n=1 Tax=Gossypium mustelinum TaxID=34275 RepID=A0A5D2WJM6_GOSMU|nr:hypothetical protein E1A91_A13G185400v1 [Gossypium mustelinum]